MPLQFTLQLDPFSATYDIQSYSKEGDDYVFHCIKSDNDQSDYGCENCECSVKVNQRQVVERINDTGHKDGTVYLLPEILFANIEIYAKYSPIISKEIRVKLDQSKTIYFYLGPCKGGRMSQLCGEEEATKEELTSIAPKPTLYAQFKQYVGL